MERPTNLRQIQKLAGRVAALSRFIARLGEKALPLYALMRKAYTNKFEWTDEAQTALDELKQILSTSPILVTPHENETMLLYIAATTQVVSTVLVVEREEAGKGHGVQRPVYYLSKVLTPPKQRYPLSPEVGLRRLDDITKTTTLLHGSPDNRRIRSTTEKHTHKPRRHRASVSMGH